MTSRPVPALVIAGVCTLGLVLFGSFLVVAAQSDMYRSLIPGLWLGLGQDLAHGVLYRPLVGPMGYGGTRYFPLNIALIAAFMRAGLPPFAAGYGAAAVSAAVLMSGLYSACRALGQSVRESVLFATCGLVPYFVGQSLLEFRCDVLAAGLNLWGVSALLTSEDNSRREPRAYRAAIWFALSFSAKPTSLVVPGAAFLALLTARRVRAAVRLAASLTVGAMVVVAVTALASGGRSIESWTSAMFAGLGAQGTLSALFHGVFLHRIAYSHFLLALIVADAVVIALVYLTRRGTNSAVRANDLIVLAVLAGVTTGTAAILGSPGAVPSNHAVEWIEVSVLTFAWAARGRLRLAVSSLAAGILLLGAGQGFSQARTFVASAIDHAPHGPVAARLSGTPGPMLSEVAIWPMLRGEQPAILDPFMFKILADARPDFGQNLADRLEKREFGTVILEEDPSSPRGGIWYSDVDLGRVVTDAILRNYRLDRQLADDVYVYVRR